MKPKYFKSQAKFRQWLETNHARVSELWVGFYKKDSGLGGLTYPEALDEALCFGWIDGVKKRVDDQSFTQRFTPRRPRSIWSRININHVKRLKKAGRMMPAGLKAFAARETTRTGVYSFENSPRKLTGADETQFKEERAAWQFFQQQPPGYQRLAIWYVVSAKKPETRTRRLRRLIADSAARKRLV